jgi:hypothetical protein
MLKKVMPIATSTDLVHECQNLNSGSLRAKGLKKVANIKKIGQIRSF